MRTSKHACFEQVPSQCTAIKSKCTSPTILERPLQGACMQSEDPDLLQAMVVSFMIHHFLKPPGDVGLRKDLHPAAQAEPFHL